MSTPRESRRATRLPYYGFLMMAALQVLVAMLVMHHRQDVWETVRAHHPTTAGKAIEGQTNGMVCGAAIMHGVIALIYLRLALGVRVGRLRIWATVIVVLTSLGGLAFLRSAPSILPS